MTYRRAQAEQAAHGASRVEKGRGQTHAHISPRDGPPLLTGVLGLPSKQGQRQASLDVLVPVDRRSDAGKDLGVRGDGNGQPCAPAPHGRPHPPTRGLLPSHRTGGLPWEGCVCVFNREKGSLKIHASLKIQRQMSETSSDRNDRLRPRPPAPPREGALQTHRVHKPNVAQTRWLDQHPPREGGPRVP